MVVSGRWGLGFVGNREIGFIFFMYLFLEEGFRFCFRFESGCWVVVVLRVDYFGEVIVSVFLNILEFRVE